MLATMNGVVGLHEGRFHDNRIESLFLLTIAGNIHSDDYDNLLHDVLCEFIMPQAPKFFASKITRGDGTVLTYLAALGFDFVVTSSSGTQWPGDFTYAPDCCYAVAVAYPFYGDTGDSFADYGPGLTVNLAGLAGIIQLARESCDFEYNQGKLSLH